MVAANHQLKAPMNIPVIAAASTTASTAPAWQDKLIEYVIGHSGAFVSALSVVVVGFIVAGWIGKLMNRSLERKTIEPPMRLLLVRVVRLLIFAIALGVRFGTARL